MAKWERISYRGNVEDRRALGGVVGGIGVTGVVLLLALNFLAGGDLSDAISLIEQVPVEDTQVDTSQFAGEDEYEVFASTVLGSANNTWSNLLPSYTEPTLVLFRDSAETECGVATSTVGPFYCPLDRTIYLDETFFDELENRFGARGGDVSEAYVIAHEVGHHVQDQLNMLSPGRSNAESIAIELQADCFAGIWANSIRDQQVFEEGEIIEAMDAASAVGDDRIQGSLGGQVNPETWTHGSSSQRVEAFSKGYDIGTQQSCSITNFLQ